MNNKTIIVILGMHRSGTSALSGFLHKLGIDMGKYYFYIPNSDNPKGNFENREFMKLNQNLLEQTGKNIYWYSLPSYQKIKKISSLLSNKDKIKKLLERHSKETISNIWGWKDPRTCLFLDLWYEGLKDYKVKYIVIFRHPIFVSQSIINREILYNINREILYKRNYPFDMEYCLKMWKRYNIDILKFLKKYSISPFVIEYDELFNDLENIYRLLCKNLNIHPSFNEKKIAFEFIEQKLCHFMNKNNYHLSEDISSIYDQLKFYKKLKFYPPNLYKSLFHRKESF